MSDRGLCALYSRWLVVLCVGLFVGLVGCKSSEEADGDSESARSEVRSEVGPDLAPPSDDVRTIQLYGGSNERSLPVTTLRGDQPITLEFDLMERQGRPLSIYFQHADRTWRRDLSASRVLESFQDDNLTDYRSSRSTDVPYVHYTYRFPNDDIRFRVSGNYIVRVTERGRRDSVLFERAFFVTEQEGGLGLGAESIVIPSQRQPSVRPRARYDPPSELEGDPFGYSVCFLRNGRMSEARCDEQPRLTNQPDLEFEVDRQQAFAPTTADYGLDLGSLDGTSEVERTDRSVSPIQVLLAPDYARFGDDAPRLGLNGQIVVREAVRNRSDPALTAEYVETTFAFVPPEEQPFADEITVAGSFSGMDPDQGTQMEWVAMRDRYEGTVLLKQGQYQYFYWTSDPSLQQEVRRHQAQSPSTYMAFFY